ncbi:MAG: ABC transporter permease [Actinomycetota bacterium]|nr:ABC transporter permease [Actinomycetota bacterium]
MRTFRDLFQVAIGGLFARKVRTVLLLLGPMIGVAAIIAAVGLTDSAKGDLKAKVRQLGTNLIVATAASSFGTETPTLPEDAVARAETVRTVEKVSAVVSLSDITVSPYAEAEEQYETIPVPVMAADTSLPNVLEVDLVEGRWLNDFDENEVSRGAVIGLGLAREIEYLPGEPRTIELDGVRYGVIGVLDEVELDPTLDNAVFITFSAADADFLADDVLPTQLYVRSFDGEEEVTADALRTAISLGGSKEVATEIKSEALELAAQSDRQLQLIVVSMGLLAIIVGGIGIANVMSISVIQRSTEIGIRRALGHTRKIIAGQFLLESAAVGLMGGILGVGLGMLAIFVGASIAGWVFTMATWLPLAGIILAIVVSMTAGIYPAWRAARLEPLETLRLG